MRINKPVARLAFPTDEHAPYQDDNARSIALKIVADFDPTIVMSGSDALDFYALSKFDKDPNRLKGGIYKEIQIWKGMQKEWIDASPNAEFYFLLGNHERRYVRTLWQMPEFLGIDAFDLNEVLALSKQNIVWDDEGQLSTELQINEAVVVKHGSIVRKESAYTAKAELEKEKYSISVLTGHTHRGGHHYSTSRTGMKQSVEGYCLCDLNPSYIEHPNWQNGIVLAEINGNDISFETIAFHGVGKQMTARWRGKEYRA